MKLDSKDKREKFTDENTGKFKNGRNKRSFVNEVRRTAEEALSEENKAEASYIDSYAEKMLYRSIEKERAIKRSYTETGRSAEIEIKQVQREIRREEKAREDSSQEFTTEAEVIRDISENSEELREPVIISLKIEEVEEEGVFQEKSDIFESEQEVGFDTIPREESENSGSNVEAAIILDNSKWKREDSFPQLKKEVRPVRNISEKLEDLREPVIISEKSEGKQKAEEPKIVFQEKSDIFEAEQEIGLDAVQEKDSENLDPGKEAVFIADNPVREREAPLPEFATEAEVIRNTAENLEMIREPVTVASKGEAAEEEPVFQENPDIFVAEQEIVFFDAVPEKESENSELGNEAIFTVDNPVREREDYLPEFTTEAEVIRNTAENPEMIREPVTVASKGEAAEEEPVFQENPDIFVAEQEIVFDAVPEKESENSELGKEAIFTVDNPVREREDYLPEFTTEAEVIRNTTEKPEIPREAVIISPKAETTEEAIFQEKSNIFEDKKEIGFDAVLEDDFENAEPGKEITLEEKISETAEHQEEPDEIEVDEENLEQLKDSNIVFEDERSFFSNPLEKHFKDDEHIIFEDISINNLLKDEAENDDSETKDFMTKEERLELLKSKRRDSKKGERKELRKIAVRTAVAKFLNAKKHIQNQLGDMSGESSGDLLKDGSTGLLRTFIDTLKEIGMSIMMSIGSGIIKYLGGLVSILFVPVMMILIVSVLLLGTVAAVGSVLAANSDTGESYDLDVNGDGFVCQQLTVPEIDEIILSLYENYEGMVANQDLAVRYALSKVGCEYNQDYHGSLTVDIFDCSSLVYRAYRETGIDISNNGAYTAAGECQAMVNQNKIIGGDLQPGDLIFYGGSDNGRYLGVYHVSMYVGCINGVDKMVEARGRSWGVVYCDVRTENIVKIARPNNP